MYYFYEKEDKIEKYLVTFSRKKIEEIREEIINNCSIIEHVEYDGPIFEQQPSKRYQIRNFESEFLYTRQSKNNIHIGDNGSDVGVQDIFHHSYDKYIYSEIIFYIDELLNGNAEVLKEGMPQNNFEETLKNKIKQAYEDFESISDLDIEAKQEKFETLQKLWNQEELNKYQQPINVYWTKLHELINLKLVDTISIEEIARVDSFYGKETEYTRKLSRKRELS